MPTLGQVIKQSFDRFGFAETLKISRPAQLYGNLFEEVTPEEIGRGNYFRLKGLANKTLDMQRPFLIIGETILFYSGFLTELAARNDQ